MKKYTVSHSRPLADLGGEQAPLPEAVSIMEIGVMTEPTEGALLSREHSTVPPRAKSCPVVRTREAVRLYHFRLSAEKAYAGWTKRFVIFHGMRHSEK